MLLNLGLTADAAAAHGNEVVGAPQEPDRAGSHSSPRVSFAAFPLPGIQSLYTRYRGGDTSEPKKDRNSAMAQTNDGSLLSSDGESSVGTSAPSQPGRSSTRKGLSRPKTSYQLAHPAAHARHKHLKFRPKLLLQLQQLSHIPRPLPILDVLPSTVHLPRLTRKFPTIFRGRNGLGPNDLIVVKSDLHGRTLDKSTKPNRQEDEDDHQVIATICQLLNEDSLSKGEAEICLNYGPIWMATPLSNGSYEFVADTDEGRRIMRWALRGRKNRRMTAPAGTGLQEESKRFTFSVIDRNTRRHPVVASMTENHLDVFDRYSTPSSVAKSPEPATSAMDDTSQAAPLDDQTMAMDDKLRTLIVITSIWVAFREGWSHNFSYNDSALALNSKATSVPSSSRHNSPTRANDGSAEYPDRHSNALCQNGSKSRISFSNVRRSRTSLSTEQFESMSPGSLNKRSNSTGAAFLRRSSRQSASGTSGRLNRHSMRSRTRELPRDSASTSTPAQSEYEDHSSRSLSHEANMENTSATKELDHADDPSHGDAFQTETPVDSPRHRNTTSSDAKPKRRHRISGIFDFLTKRSGNH